MRGRLPGSGKDKKLYCGVAFAAFGLGIIVSFFLSPRMLVLVEAAVIIGAVALCFSDG
ncbi:MAG: hypothetical protein IJO00_02835 [Clostridia bacterium]|nr:hypothetical protein [Clostridia bacterium]